MFYTTYMNKKIVLLILLSTLLFLSFKYWSRGCNCNLKSEVTLGGVTLNAYISDTDEERAQGLSDKTSLLKDEGMLFVFEKPAKYGFWMKDMLFAIDIIWIGEDKKVLGIERGVKPETFPETFYPPSEVLYVFEVPSGFSDTHGIEVGQTLSLEE